MIARTVARNTADKTAVVIEKKQFLPVSSCPVLNINRQNEQYMIKKSVRKKNIAPNKKTSVVRS